MQNHILCILCFCCLKTIGVSRSDKKTKHTDTHLNYCAISVVLPVSGTELKPAGIN